MKEDVVYGETVLAVKTVVIAGAYLHRVRVWDKRSGDLLVAMRMWSDKPYTRGSFIKMTPDAPQASRQLRADWKEQEAAEEGEGASLAGAARAEEEAAAQAEEDMARAYVEGGYIPPPAEEQV